MKKLIIFGELSTGPSRPPKQNPYNRCLHKESKQTTIPFWSLAFKTYFQHTPKKTSSCTRACDGCSSPHVGYCFLSLSKTTKSTRGRLKNAPSSVFSLALVWVVVLLICCFMSKPKIFKLLTELQEKGPLKDQCVHLSLRVKRSQLSKWHARYQMRMWKTSMGILVPVVSQVLTTRLVLIFLVVASNKKNPQSMYSCERERCAFHIESRGRLWLAPDTFNWHFQLPQSTKTSLLHLSHQRWPLRNFFLWSVARWVWGEVTSYILVMLFLYWIAEWVNA